MKRLIAIIIVLLFQYSFSQKYILLDSLTAHYDTKKYTFSTLPYGSENTIELYNVFFKDYLLLVSVLPDYERNIWQEISFKSIQNNILSTKDLFKIDFGYVRAVKKEGNKYFASEFCNVERFLFSNKKIEKQKEDKCALLDFQQQIFPFDKMRNIYKKRYPNYMFPLDQRPYQSYEISYNPNIPNSIVDTIVNVSPIRLSNGIIKSLSFISILTAPAVAWKKLPCGK